MRRGTRSSVLESLVRGGSFNFQLPCLLTGVGIHLTQSTSEVILSVPKDKNVSSRG